MLRDYATISMYGTYRGGYYDMTTMEVIGYKGSNAYYEITNMHKKRYLSFG